MERLEAASLRKQVQLGSIVKKAQTSLEKVKLAEANFFAAKRRLSDKLETKQSAAAELHALEIREIKKRVGLHNMKRVGVVEKKSDVGGRLMAAGKRRQAIEAELLAKLSSHHTTVAERYDAQRYDTLPR